MKEICDLSKNNPLEELSGAIDSTPVFLANGEVHVWSASLDIVSEEQRYLRLLNEEEKTRAQRLRSRLGGSRFIASRGQLRIILSRYAGIDPADILFAYGENGKPALAGQDCGITFNLAHSAGLAMIAVARNRSVGIDVEAIDPGLRFIPMAERYFSRLELSILRSLPEDRRLDAFYACWTRKEAYMKACGAGFSLRSNSFSISPALDALPELLNHDLHPEETARWFLADLPAPDNYRGALAVEGKSLDIRYFTLRNL